MTEVMVQMMFTMVGKQTFAMTMDAILPPITIFM